MQPCENIQGTGIITRCLLGVEVSASPCSINESESNDQQGSDVSFPDL